MRVLEFLRESNAIEGVYDEDSFLQAQPAWEYLMTEKELTHGVLLKTHKILMLNQKGLYPNERGYFREVPVYIGGKEALKAPFIRIALTAWLEAMNMSMRNESSIEALERRSKGLHVEYEGIHPFVDGNGHTGRMFMNWWRLTNGVPLVIIREDMRHEYYKWFQHGDTH